MRDSLCYDAGVDGHAVLHDAPLSVGAASSGAVDAAGAPEHRLLTLSARDPEALRASAKRCLDRLSAPAPADRPSLRDLARTMALRSDHHDHRLAIVADDIE